jgi:hypothetical protein
VRINPKSGDFGYVTFKPAGCLKSPKTESEKHASRERAPNRQSLTPQAPIANFSEADRSGRDSGLLWYIKLPGGSALEG